MGERRKQTAEAYGLQEKKIKQIDYIPYYGEIMIANQDSKGGLTLIPQSKGKKIISMSGGNRKLFIFEEQNELENVVTALHSENQDYLEYKGEEVLPIHEIVMSLEGNKINEIRSGKQHNIILTDQGVIFAYGKGNFGSLGLGGTVFCPSPRPILKLQNKKITSIACGQFHSLALSQIGDVFSWGRGFEGQLGLLDNIESISSPHFIPHFFKYNSDKDVKKLQKVPIHYIACGAYHSIAIDHESRIYCWGEARYGQTGDGKKSKETVPKKLSIQIDNQERKIVKASGGFGHTLCLTEEGEIFSWGLNIKGQLGLNDLPQNMKTTEENLSYVKALYKPRHIYESRDKSLLPKFKDICCGFSSSYAIDIEGNAWAWGGGNLGFKDKFIERGPVKITQGTQNKQFSKIFANQSSVLLFCNFTPLYFKPCLVPSSGKTQLTFFGNGFTHTGLQSARFSFEDEKVEVDLEYDEKTSTFYCQTPIFEKINKRLTYPLLCKIQLSLDKTNFVQYQKSLLVYSSKLQIQSIEPNCGSALGGSIVRLYMPLDTIVQSYTESITVGFKNTSNSYKKDNKVQNNADWLCSEGVYNNEVITCKIPNIPQFDHQNPFFMLDVSINGQEFTDLPHTFRYYLITDLTVTPHEGLDDAESDILIQGKGLFDSTQKKLILILKFQHKQQKFECERNVEIKWNKAEKNFSFKMPKLSWIIGDHECTPELLQSARKSACLIRLYLGKDEFIEVGRFTFVLPPPPPQPQEDKKDSKKDAKKAAKK